MPSSLWYFWRRLCFVPALLHSNSSATQGFAFDCGHGICLPFRRRIESKVEFFSGGRLTQRHGDPLGGRLALFELFYSEFRAAFDWIDELGAVYALTLGQKRDLPSGVLTARRFS